jgi:hypothetical protein
MADAIPPLEPPEIKMVHKMMDRGNPWTTAIGIMGLHGGELSSRNIMANLNRHGLIEKKPVEEAPRFAGESRQMLYRIREDVPLPPIPPPKTPGRANHAPDREAAILKAVEALPPYSLASTIAKKAGMSDTSTGEALRRLVERGLLERKLGESLVQRRQPWLYRIRPVETKEEQQEP